MIVDKKEHNSQRGQKKLYTLPEGVFTLKARMLDDLLFNTPCKFPTLPVTAPSHMCVESLVLV